MVSGQVMRVRWELLRVRWQQGNGWLCSSQGTGSSTWNTGTALAAVMSQELWDHYAVGDGDHGMMESLNGLAWEGP